MASPPAPPPLPARPLFTAAEFNAARSPSASSSSSNPSSLTHHQYAIPPPTISLADTIADVVPFIPISLDLAAHNYYHWRHLFHIHLGRCGLRHHIHPSSVPQPANPRWVKDDLTIIQWIYTRISTELFNLVSNDDATAADLWAALQQLFQDNSDARINALHTELRTITQGDSPVTVFCQRIKSIGDELRQLGDHVDDRVLINALLVGLGEQFEKQVAFIPMLRPYPSFGEVRSLLQLEAQNQARKATRLQVFHASTKSSAPAPSTPSAAPVQPPPGWRPSPNYRGKNPVYRPPQPRSASSSASSSSTPSSTPTASTPTAWHQQQDPWTGLVQAWPMPWSAPSPYDAPPAYTGAWSPGHRPATGSPGLLGPRSPAHVYTATTTPTTSGAPMIPPGYALVPYAPGAPSAPSPYAYGQHAPMNMPAPSPTTTSPSWDQAAFIAAMNNFTLNNEGSDNGGGSSSVQ
ncbi:protein transport protein SEC31 [Triticum aestivum]|uniref:protein transport protein SEC31 n=1 Tax=Triticum aestivum TaxID=4565 RepID=UPI00084303A7|nr:protein transport protein SEC31-like [Triticum aestivum]XP_044370837.1 protein transport protein SEC31-like [Triticum aestivum]XP_044370838.1 protein transport protein SEC31-like [Triticum aestivum]